jgi:hypothetical protein
VAGHGWVTPNPDGMKARCGGPGICGACALEAGAKLQAVAGAARKVWESQDGWWFITPQELRDRDWTVVEVTRDAMAELGEALGIRVDA